MNKINYQIKYIEYLLRKCRTILTNDISFHADRLREISGTYPDLLNPVTLNEKICHRILFIKDGQVFNELHRGTDTRKDFFAKILEVVSVLGGEQNDLI